MQQHRKELREYREGKTVELPPDYTQDIPAKGLVWLLKNGISADVARHYKFGWSDKFQRVVLPVWNGGELVQVQNRAIYDWQKPKYVNCEGSGDMPAYFVSSEPIMLRNRLKGLVITEDISSCVRVGRVCQAVSTLGTKLSDKLAVQPLFTEAEHIYIWYDNDAGGRKGVKQASSVLRLLGLPFSVIHTDKDPKYYSNDEIRKIIND